MRKKSKTTSRELIFSIKKEELEWEYFRAGGKGGQNVNKRDTAVRVRHAPSGAVATSQEHRTQHRNRVQALRRLSQDPKFRAWCRARVGGLDATVERLMAPENLLIEYGPF